jgi:hypothetical protein
MISCILRFGMRIVCDSLSWPRTGHKCKPVALSHQVPSLRHYSVNITPQVLKPVGLRRFRRCKYLIKAVY